MRRTSEPAGNTNEGIQCLRCPQHWIGSSVYGQTNLDQTINPDAYYLEFYRGRNLYDAGEAAQALLHFEQALQGNPEHEDLPYIYSYMGSVYKDLEQYDLALDTLRKGLEEDEERSDIHNMMGVY